MAIPFGAAGVLFRKSCQRTSIQEIASPGGLHVAEQIITDCGKRMHEASEVRIRRVDVETRSIDEETVLILPEKTKLVMHWSDPKTLLVTLPDNQSQVVKYKPEWDGLKIGVIGEIISSAPKDIENAM